MTLSILIKQHSSDLLRGNILNVLEWPTQSPDLNPIENLWYDLKFAVHQWNPSNLKELEQFCLNEWEKIQLARCARGWIHTPRDLQM
jgi:transposase